MSGPFAPPALPGFRATTSPSAPSPRIGTRLLMGPPLGVLPSHRGKGSHVPHKSLREAHAAFMPVTTRAVDRLPPSFIPDQQLEPGFDDVPTLSTDRRRFTHVRLPRAHLTGWSRLFRSRSPPGPLRPRSSRWFGSRSCNPNPRGRPSSLVQQGCFQAAIAASLLRRRGAQSSANRTMYTSPRACFFLHDVTHRSST